MAVKIVVIGKGEFGNSLAQGLELATVPKDNTDVTVEQVSATKFFANDVDSTSKILANAAYVMYCGKMLSEHAEAMASALENARHLSSIPVNGTPLLEFMDWSNPDPTKESYDGAVSLSLIRPNTVPQVVWKITGVSSLDVTGHAGKQVASVYSSYKGGIPSIGITGIVWKPAIENSLVSEVADRLMIRADVDRWYDATFLGAAVFLFAFAYAFTRYSVWVNGGYDYTMIPLYIMDKAIAWTALWMISVAPFAGNLLMLINAFSNWEVMSCVDKLVSLLGTSIMMVPLLLFALPWLTWAVLRILFSSWNTKSANLTRIHAMLIDMVSLKTETGVVGFACLLTHAFMGALVAVPQYKSKWFDPDNKMRFYGNNEVSMASGAIAFTLVTLLMIRSLIGKDSWMKLKPLYTYVSPLAIALATFHVIMMGYKGWDSLFKYSTKKGQPSITFVSTMLPLGVIVVHLLSMFIGTKARARKNVRIEKHSATNHAFAKYDKVKGDVAIDKTSYDLEMSTLASTHASTFAMRATSSIDTADSPEFRAFKNFCHED